MGGKLIGVEKKFRAFQFLLLKATNKICDLLSENLALPANIEFDLEAILSVQVVFQLNSDYCTKVLQGACILNYEAQLCYYKDAISLNSQAGQ